MCSRIRWEFLVGRCGFEGRWSAKPDTSIKMEYPLRSSCWCPVREIISDKELCPKPTIVNLDFMIDYRLVGDIIIV